MSKNCLSSPVKEDMDEFINRCKTVEVQKMLHDQRYANVGTRWEEHEPDLVSRYGASNRWGRENPEKLRAAQKKYEATEKGRLARLRVNCTRTRRFREAIKNLTSQEIEDIKEFYMHRPEGCHVDHIMPLSKGGAHHRSNLQYLTAEENFKKKAWVSSEVLWEHRQRKYAERREKSKAT